MSRWISLIHTEQDEYLIKVPQYVINQLTIFPRNRVRLFDLIRLLSAEPNALGYDYFQLMNLIFNRGMAVDFCFSKDVPSTDRRIKDDE